ncbi:MAG: transposase [Bacteroidota bacterium]
MDVTGGRRAIRIPGYDYSQPGAYYVTIVVHGRENLLGVITDGQMRLNKYGQVVQQAWFDLPNHYAHVELDAFTVMPNHVHSILILSRGGSEAGSGDDLQAGVLRNSACHANPPETRPYYRRHPLSDIVRAFKSFSARRINLLRHTTGIPVWQRNYYEHVIRDNMDYRSKSTYILENPLHWGDDDENVVLQSRLRRSFFRSE